MSSFIEPLRDAADGFELSRLSFGSVGEMPFDPERPISPNDRTHCIYDGDRLVAKSRSIDMAQFFGGRSVSMGGLSGVGVAPTDRGRGLAKAVVTASLEGMLERGDLISSLFPTTASLYNGLGYGFAGTYGVTYVPMAALPSWAELDEVARTITFEPCAWEAVIDDAVALATAMAQPQNGSQHHQDLYWQQVRHDWHKHAGAKLLVRGVRDGETVAVVAYQHEDPVSGGLFSLWLETIAVADGAALAAAFAYLAGHGTTVDVVKTTLPVEYFARVLRGGEHLQPNKRSRVMTRLVDVAGALTARGYAPGVTGAVALCVDDPVLAHNAGTFVLQVEDGEGQVVAGGTDPLVLSVATLSAIYTGALTPPIAANLGLLSGGTERDRHLLGAMFAGPLPCFEVFF